MAYSTNLGDKIKIRNHELEDKENQDHRDKDAIQSLLQEIMPMGNFNNTHKGRHFGTSSRPWRRGWKKPGM